MVSATWRHIREQARLWFDKYPIEIGIFFLAFGVRLAYTIFIKHSFGENGFLAYADASVFYLRGAINLVANNGFSLDTVAPYMPDSYRMPLYTYLVAAILWLRLPIISIIILQDFLMGVIAVLTYKIGNLLFLNKKISLIAALAVCLEPMSIYWNSLLMSDTLFGFLFLLSAYHFILRRYYIFSFIFGLAVLTRPTWWFFLVFVLFMIFINFKKNQSRIISLRTALFSILIFVAVICPWIIRNKIIFDVWGLSSAASFNFSVAITREFAEQNSLVYKMPLPPSGYPNPEHFTHDFSNVSFYDQQAREIVMAHPTEYAKFYALRVFRTVSSNPYLYLYNYVFIPKFSLPDGFLRNIINIFVKIGGLFWVSVFCLALFAFFEKHNREWTFLFFILLAIHFFTLGALVPPGADGSGADSSRYLMPLAPLLFLFAGLGAKNVLSRLV